MYRLLNSDFLPGVDASEVLGARGGYGYEEQQVRHSRNTVAMTKLQWVSMMNSRTAKSLTRFEFLGQTTERACCFLFLFVLGWQAYIDSRGHVNHEAVTVPLPFLQDVSCRSDTTRISIDPPEPRSAAALQAPAGAVTSFDGTFTTVSPPAHRLRTLTTQETPG